MTKVAPTGPLLRDEQMADDMELVWKQLDAAQLTIARCRRVVAAHAALYKAEEKLREALAEFKFY